MTVVRIDGAAIVDWDSFHDEFHRAFGFPDFYGRNLNAWIDCMTCLDDPQAGMSRIHVAPGAVLTLQVDNARVMRDRNREQFDALVECAAFVNWRRVDVGEAAVLALAFDL